jgi:hypothetical protein
MAMVWALVIVELGGRLGGVRQHHRKVLGEKAGAWLRPVDLNSTLGGKIRFVLPFSLANPSPSTLATTSCTTYGLQTLCLIK